MSNDSNRNPRGLHVRQRNAAGEVIPEPAIPEGGVGPNGLFARMFAVIATGLLSLPENIVAAVRTLPETFFPPPWLFWMLVHVIQQVANHRRAWEFIRASCPVRCSHVERRGWHADAADMDNDEFECTFAVFSSEAAVTVRRRDLDFLVRIPLRIEAVSASEINLHAWPDSVPLDPEELAWHDDDERYGMARARLQDFVPASRQEDLLGDLRTMQLVLGDEDVVMAVRDYDQVALDLCRRLESPQWCPWVAALAGDWFLLEDLAAAANDQELLADARRRTDLCIQTWLTDPMHMKAAWGRLDESSDWRPYCLRMIHRRGPEYFRERIQPYLRDLRWIADWGDALLPFCDESWRPDLLRVIERLLNTPRYVTAMKCVEHLLQDAGSVDAAMQAISETGILDAERWEELAFLLMAHALHLAMPAIENALLHGKGVALPSFLAVIDTEWSRHLLQRQLQDSRQSDPMRRLHLLTALSYSNDVEVARAARRSLSELTGLPGRRRERDKFQYMLDTIRRDEHSYAREPTRAAEHLASSLSIYLTNNGVGWEMSAATVRLLLGRLVANRLADVAVAPDGGDP